MNPQVRQRATGFEAAQATRVPTVATKSSTQKTTCGSPAPQLTSIPLFACNHATWYVADVLTLAARYVTVAPKPSGWPAARYAPRPLPGHRPRGRQAR